jgi:hypothetical protein
MNALFGMREIALRLEKLVTQKPHAYQDLAWGVGGREIEAGLDHEADVPRTRSCTLSAPRSGA